MLQNLRGHAGHGNGAKERQGHVAVRLDEICAGDVRLFEDDDGEPVAGCERELALGDFVIGRRRFGVGDLEAACRRGGDHFGVNDVQGWRPERDRKRRGVCEG